LAGGRQHFQHGPIDLVLQAWGEADEVQAACEQGWNRFQDVLETLVKELPLLRSPLGAAYPLARGPVARRMVAAVWPHREVFVTPMAAVAGGVADELLEAMLAGRRLRKAYVNDGGDIAVHVAPGETLVSGIVGDVAHPALDATMILDAPCGIATSGWRGRSQSLGIADAVTVLARSAAEADAAATLLANAVNVEHPAIRRASARRVKGDSDLGDLPVTVEVGTLPREAVDAALEAGLEAARSFCDRGLIRAALLLLQGRVRWVAPAVHTSFKVSPAGEGPPSSASTSASNTGTS
jgi:ApbE superfamily uncharacterized protein (UPF0280 family)